MMISFIHLLHESCWNVIRLLYHKCEAIIYVVHSYVCGILNWNLAQLWNMWTEYWKMTGENSCCSYVTLEYYGCLWFDLIVWFLTPYVTYPNMQNTKNCYRHLTNCITKIKISCFSKTTKNICIYYIMMVSLWPFLCEYFKQRLIYMWLKGISHF